MANNNSPFGLRLNNSGGKCAAISEYTIASGYATGLFEGDVVKLSGTGRNIIQAPVGDDDPIGVFIGVRYVDPQGRQQFASQWPAAQVATEIKALVYDDPGFEFIAQADSFAVADAGKQAEWTIGAGNTRTGISGMEVTASAAGADKSLVIVGLAEKPKNVAGAYAKIRVKFAKHALAVN